MFKFVLFIFVYSTLYAAPTEVSSTNKTSIKNTPTEVSSTNKTSIPNTTTEDSSIDSNFKYGKKIDLYSLSLKKEGWYFTGVPLFNYSSLDGFGFGLRAAFFYNGTKLDPRFEYVPYLHQVFVQSFVTTALHQIHGIFWDAPYISKIGSAWLNVTSVLYYESTHISPYFGVGDAANDPLFFAGKQYSKMSDYDKTLADVSNTNGTTNFYYNYYKYQLPTFYTNLGLDVFKFWGGILRTSFGFLFRWSHVTDYSGQTVKVDGKTYTANDTKLKDDITNGRIFGLGSSWNNTLKVAIGFDSRDYEPNPHRGVFTDFVAEVIPQFLGSNTNYYRFTYTLRLFYDPIPRYPKLVLAARSLYTFNLGDVPFYAMNEIGTTENFGLQGLGGISFKGYFPNRFIGNAKSLSNFEIRWQFWDVSFWKQHFAFMIVPFFEVGRAFDSIQKTSYRDWKLSYGSGLRIIWNQATIIAFHYGASKEAQYIYVDFNHTF